ncbi:uncharacterized protein LOC103703201 [Phoenix dactylifera]|uniref:Uncharacterized protein LOC103703201 n=1 Tax=Phoenix dactylifera TaxID=42345 RepID=A0A8B7BS57_PHODC|nr:uncharacterized protein LOC103703201 [Phoenix dactylifera]
MNIYGEDLPRCYFHPKQVVVGICSLCLRERLLNLASKQGHKHPQAEDTRRSLVLKRKLTICLPRFYAVSSILHRLKFRHQRTNDGFDECSIPSQDSFISVNFVDDDQPAPHGQNKEGGSMEYVKQPGIPRWRKKIGRLFEFAKWKGSPKPGTCKERNQGGKGWTKSLN